MRILIHDLDPQEFTALGLTLASDTTVISDSGTIKNCIGCFGCWVKTPGKCVLKDDYQDLGQLLSKCDELTIVSRCLYGSYSPFVRNVLDRSISFLLPYFMYENGETHHKPRYEHHFPLFVHFYGNDLTKKEQDTARELVEANSINFHCTGNKVCFHNNLQSVKEELK